MGTGQTPKKFRNLMYEQQLRHLPNGMTVDEILSHIDTVLKPKRWAGIVHDQDVQKDGVTHAEDHLHVMLQFDNARSEDQVAKDIGDKPQSVNRWDDNVANGFAYLIHATKRAREKHQYSADEVKANFDYVEYINRLMQKAAKDERISSANHVNGLLDLIGSGKAPLKEVKDQLSGSVYAKYASKLDKAHALYLERRADELHRTMKENNELVNVHWFFGRSETGKSFLARKLAAEMGEYYLTSAAKDAFQYYQAEPIIILDELRPQFIPYSELLSMFDPFSRGKVTVSSRYHNKPLACRTFFITTPYNPLAFYGEYDRSETDSVVQLARRLSSVLYFQEDCISKLEYNAASKCYLVVDKKPNPYSKQNQKTYQLDNIFDKI